MEGPIGIKRSLKSLFREGLIGIKRSLKGLFSEGPIGIKRSLKCLKDSFLEKILLVKKRHLEGFQRPF